MVNIGMKLDTTLTLLLLILKKELVSVGHGTCVESLAAITFVLYTIDVSSLRTTCLNGTQRKCT